MSDSEIDLIINKLIKTVTLSEENNSSATTSQNVAKMTTPASGRVETVDYSLLRLYIESIAKFDGNPHTLGVFLDTCQNLITTFANPNNPNLNSFLLRAVIGKLEGRALSLIGSRTELRTWNDIKNALTLSFGDQRNIDCLIQDLIVLRPNKNEAPYSFGMRCQDARSLIISKLNTLPITVEEKTVRLQTYDDLALKTFIRGLAGHIQNNIRLRNPTSLEQAMSFVIEEENFLYSQNKSNSLNQQQRFTPMQRIAPAQPYANFPKFNPQPHFKPVQFQQFRPQNSQFQQAQFHPQQSQFQQSQFRPQFPNSSFQQQFRQNMPFPTQKHPYFSQRPSQIRRNEQQHSQNQNRNSNHSNISRYPKPMDTSSGNTPPISRPRYTFTELHAQDISQNLECENPFEYEHNAETDPNYEYYDSNRFVDEQQEMNPNFDQTDATTQNFCLDQVTPPET